MLWSFVSVFTFRRQ